MLKRNVGENKFGVSPVIGIILMVAITIVLSGMLYYWIQDLSSSNEKGLSYVGFDVNEVAGSDDWVITIQQIQGNSIPLDDLALIITKVEGITLYEKNIGDANPKSLSVGGAIVYPIANNSSVVTSIKTSQPVTAEDDFNDYYNAIFVIIDYDADKYLTSGDLIRIYSDFDKDGNREIFYGNYFKLKNQMGTKLYIQYSL
jgi:flagellin-like protein